MRIVDKLKKNKIVRSVWNEYKKINTFILLKKSTIHLKKNHKSNSSVFFICQCEYIWNKSRPLYLELKNQGIDCKLFVIPDKININKEKTIFESEFPQDVIKYSKNLLKKYKPGLVIYSRPYDILLPKDIQSKNVVKYTRTAFIPYYYSLEYDYKLLLGKKFLYNIKYFISDQKLTKNYFDEVCKKNVDNGLQIGLDLGYPLFDSINICKKNSQFQNLNNNKINIIWAPRWTNDSKFGSSNFSKYYQDIFNYFIDNDKFNFVFRPHPLLFPNFIKNNLITVKDKENIIERFEKSTNSIYDVRGEYIDTINDADIVILDTSSIILDCFLLNKPMIFCDSKSKEVFTEFTNTVLEMNYIAKDFSDIKKYVELISSGNDKKIECRSIESKNFIKNQLGASKRIADYLASVINK